MYGPVCRGVLGLAIALVFSAVAFAQGSTKTSLSGLVSDATGGALPGATVEVKNNRTNVVTNVVTNSAGAFDVPAIDAGFYTISISLQGFKTAVLKDVELLSGTPRSVNVSLEIGALEVGAPQR